jgi:hypothetical protein
MRVRAALASVAIATASLGATAIASAAITCTISGTKGDDVSNGTRLTM